MSTEKEARSYFTVASGCDVTLAATLQDIMYPHASLVFRLNGAVIYAESRSSYAKLAATPFFPVVPITLRACDFSFSVGTQGVASE